MRRFDPLANAIAQELPVRDVILDGEIVVMSEGRPDFYALTTETRRLGERVDWTLADKGLK